MNLSAITVVVVSVLVASAVGYWSVGDGGQFALIRSATVILDPPANCTAHQYDRYTAYDARRYFFQWWNLLVYDAQTHIAYQFLYQINSHSEHFAQTTKLPRQFALVGVGIYDRGRRVLIGADHAEFRRLKMSADFDVRVDSADGNDAAHSLRVVSPAVYHLSGAVPATQTVGAGEVRWNLTARRLHGAHHTTDSEAAVVASCLPQSSLFAYNSIVSGSVTVGGRETHFDDTQTHIRGYLAGTWGCRLPSGDPPIDYPWTWAWAVVPATAVREEISLVFGTAKFDSSVGVDLAGAYGIVAVGSTYIVSQSAQAVGIGGIRIPLVSSSTDSFLRADVSVTTSQWTNITDDWGAATIPLMQTYTMRSKQYCVEVTYESAANEYFRAPIGVERVQTSALKVFSDFRAVGVRTQIRLRKRSSSSDADCAVIIYNGPAHINAVEYAYAPDIDMQTFERYKSAAADDKT